VTAANGLEDPSLALNNSGLLITPEHGSFEVKVYDQTTETTSTTRINVDLDGLNANDTSLDDLVVALDAVDNLNASLTQEGRLQLTTDAGYEVRFGDDSSGTLAALGINTFFNGTDSNDIEVNSLLKTEPSYLAAGFGDGPGDNRNAQRLAKFMETPSSILNGVSLDEFYADVTAQAATAAGAETSISDGFRSFQESLNGLRQQNSGVSLDEEAIKVIELQQGYSAAARIISTVDELFNILLNI